MLYGRRLVLDRREGAEDLFLFPSGGGPSLLRSSGSGNFVLTRSGPCLGLARTLGLSLRLLARALGLGLPACLWAWSLQPVLSSGPGLLVLAPSLGLGASARRGNASFLLH